MTIDIAGVEYGSAGAVPERAEGGVELLLGAGRHRHFGAGREGRRRDGQPDPGTSTTDQEALTFSVCEIIGGRPFIGLEHFPTKWTPVGRRKCGKIKDLESFAIATRS